MFVSFSHRFLPFASNAGIFEGLFIPARAVERGLRSRAATGLTGLNAGRHKRIILDRAIMNRVIKGFSVGWGDRWRRTVWAQREHIYWFNISPDRQVQFERSSSPMVLNEGDHGRLEATQAVKEFIEQEIQ
jgi:hypothetical protein